MSGKIFGVGIALSMLGLGYFFPVVIPVSAILVILAGVLMVLDK